MTWKSLESGWELKEFSILNAGKFDYEDLGEEFPLGPILFVIMNFWVRIVLLNIFVVARSFNAPKYFIRYTSIKMLKTRKNRPSKNILLYTFLNTPQG